jgi:hypothetical protein
MKTLYVHIFGSVAVHKSTLYVATYGLYSQARSYIIKLRNCLNSVRGCTIVLVIINIIAIYDQARSYIIKLRNCLNSFSTTLYVHIFGSVHAMPMKTYCIIPPFDSVKQYQLILTIVLVIINIVAIYGL